MDSLCRHAERSGCEKDDVTALFAHAHCRFFAMSMRLETITTNMADIYRVVYVCLALLGLISILQVNVALYHQLHRYGGTRRRLLRFFFSMFILFATTAEETSSLRCSEPPSMVC